MEIAQREDLVRMRPVALEHDGINVWIGKLGDKKHFVTLNAAQMAEIRSWGVSLWDQWRRTKAAAPIGNLDITIHGLRATAVVDRRLAGTEDDGIASELGMSVQMVTRYARFADKAALARASRDRREARVVQLGAKPGTDLKTGS
jgi:integrase